MTDMSTAQALERTAKCQIKIGGMQCSFCVESIRKAYSHMDGVVDVGVSLSHEEALVQYDPEKVTPTRLHDTLRAIGYTVRDPNKVRSFEEEEAELREHRNRLLLAGALGLVSLAFMSAVWVGVGEVWFRWVMLGLTLTMIFGVGGPILKMAWGSLRRGILNQHVLMEFAAFGGALKAGRTSVRSWNGLARSRWPCCTVLRSSIRSGSHSAALSVLSDTVVAP